MVQAKTSNLLATVRMELRATAKAALTNWRSPTISVQSKVSGNGHFALCGDSEIGHRSRSISSATGTNARVVIGAARVACRPLLCATEPRQVDQRSI